MQPRDWLIVGALLVLAAWSIWDRWMQAREMKVVREHIEALKARQERLQSAIDGKREGWGDSLDLTRFSWKHPGPF
jgi:hypothetical protein